MSDIKKNIIKINGETLVSNDFIRNPNLTGNEKMMYLILASHCPQGSNRCNPSIKRELTSDSGMSSKTIITLNNYRELSWAKQIKRESWYSLFYIMQNKL